MNPDYKDKETASESALRNWKKKIPLNRAGRRDQLARHKYYLELNESDTFWSVYAVKKDGNQIMLDNSKNHEPKYDEDVEEAIDQKETTEDSTSEVSE